MTQQIKHACCQAQQLEFDPWDLHGCCGSSMSTHICMNKYTSYIFAARNIYIGAESPAGIICVLIYIDTQSSTLSILKIDRIRNSSGILNGCQGRELVYKHIMAQQGKKMQDFTFAK